MKILKHTIVLNAAMLMLTLSYGQFTINAHRDTGYTTFKILNSTSDKEIFNIFFHSYLSDDGRWDVTLCEKRNESLLPGRTIQFQIKCDSAIIKYFAYDFISKGKLVHKQKDSSFVFKGNEVRPLILSDVSVPPEWWETVWFMVLLVLFSLIFIWLIVKYFSNLKIKAKNRKLENILAIQNERMRISIDMHDDIGAGLMGITLQTEMLKNRISAPDVLEDLSNIHSSITLISTKVREVIWSLNTENDTLVSLISFIHQQAHRIFKKTTIKLCILSPDDLPSFNIAGEKRRHIYLIISEALNNILKHSNARSATINFTINDDNLKIFIQDDGIGFDNTVQTPGCLGLRSIENRVQKLKGFCEISSATTGTKLNISIPIVN